MNKKNLLLFCLIILLFAIPSVLAGDAEDTVIANDNSDVLEITNQDIDEIQNDELLTEGEAKTFSDLNNAINGNSDSEVYLDSDYNYSSVSDSGFKSGITINRNVTVNGNGHTIDAKKSARIFQVNSSNVTFINITFLNGNIHKDTYAYQTLGGGAINGKCTVINCTFIGNSADYAGAIKGGTGTTAINCTFKNNLATSSNGGALYEGNAINCTFEGNTAKKNGGAIYRGSAENCNFTNNTANGTNDREDGGGAIYRGSAINCTFTKNKSYYGAAICGGSATNCNFTENYAINRGGAINNGDADNCTFTKNDAKFGGAINSGSAKNCNFTGNTASGLWNAEGGAISLPYEGYVINCTFTNNRASYQGGALYYGSSEGNITVENCTFINNRAQNGGATYFTSAVNCTFIGNSVTRQESTTGDGGAMYGWSNSHYAVNCTFINNTASNSGGAAYRDICENCTFINNSAKVGGAINLGSAENCTFINNSASSEGGAIYDAEFNNCSFENNKVGDEVNDFSFTPKFIVDYDFRTIYNSGERIFVTYTDTQGKVVDNVNISANISKNGEFIGTYYFLSGEGLLLNLEAGDYRGIFSIPDPSYGIPYRNSMLITIEKAPTTLNASSISVVYTNNKYLVVTLKDNHGRPMANANLTINLNGLKYLKTDANGQVKLATKGLKPKTYTATITFNGDNNYLKSTKSVKVVVKKAKPKITAKKKTFKKSWKVKKYKITLKYKKTAVKKVKVYIKIGKKTFKAKTNKKGKAVFKIKKFTKKGTFKAKITFKGNKYYKKVTKKVRIKIK